MAVPRGVNAAESQAPKGKNKYENKSNSQLREIAAELQSAINKLEAQGPVLGGPAQKELDRLQRELNRVRSAMEGGGGGKGSNAGGGPKAEKMRNMVEKWIEIRDQIRATNQGNAHYDLDILRRKRANLVDRIQQLAVNHPRTASIAVKAGFRVDLLPIPGTNQLPGGGTVNATPRGRNQGEQTVGAGGRTGSRTTDVDDDDDLSPPPPRRDRTTQPGSNRWLPGIKGKDFDVVRYGGKTYVVYKVKHAGNFTMRVTDDKFKAYGIREGEGRQLTKAQFGRLNNFGNAADILVHGENRHPFRQWIEQTEALYGGTGMLKNKEVMRVFLEGYAKGWAPEVIQGKLRQTKWADTTTEYQRNWGFLGTAEQKGQIETFSLRITESLKEIYGDDWLKHFPDYSKKWLSTKAKQIATGTLGAMGDPQGSLEAFIRNQTNRAEKIAGTPAAIAKQQREAERGEFLGRPENLREDLRQMVIQQIGYAGRDARIDGDTLTKWADRIAYSQLNEEGNPYTQADFDRWLRRQKQALFPELDPDEAWQDATSVRKAKAEDLLGLTLSWNDKLLTSVPFGAVDETGKPLGRRMSDLEYERLIRKDQRFWDSPTAAQEGFGLLQRLQETFQGGVV